MPRAKLEEIINEFDVGEFSQFFRLKTLAQGNFRPSTEKLSQYNDEDFFDFIKIGQIEFFETQKLLVVSTMVGKDLSERSGKKGQYEKAKKILRDMSEYSAGIFIYYDIGGNFRFSLIYPESIGTRREWSNFRRFTYFVSKELTNKTFLQRIGNGDFATLEKIKDAFSVEKVTKEFYLAYRTLFDRLVEDLSKNHTFLNEASKNHLNTENFAKKLLGQIVFLYFIQKKGWLGVPESGKWDEGDKNFMGNLFKDAMRNEANFYNDYLEELFYNTLNNSRRGSADPSFSKKFNCRIPFLNGGLFEPEYNWKDSLIYLDNKIFERIFEVFDRYNFTIEEESPDDKEVAVDPEMLGKVFENLLPENLRKGKGTYYTPREIVYYMCRESLINYLISNHSNLSEEKIRTYLQYSKALNNDISELKKIWKGESFTPGQWKELNDLLKNVKVCDPACGSGAFLVGTLNEIVRLRMFLQLTPDSELFSKEQDAIKELSEYQLKKETIQNCLYGVDIDPGAIEIAKLRLWLSLIVDYNLENIEPLPNLDYRLMTGNSLVEEFEGVKFYNGEEIEQQTTLLVDTEKQKKNTELKKKVKEYFNIHDDKEKQQKRKEINNIKDWLVRSALEKRKQDLAIQRKNEETKANMLNQKSRKRYLVSWGNKFLAEVKIKEVLDNLHNPKKEKPFFIWKLEFIDVFEDKNGFDVVIGNPPYIEHKKLKGISSKLKERFQTYSGTTDLYVYFYERGLNILRTRGIITFISSNKFIRTRYGAKLRSLLSKNKIYQIIDFTDVHVFDALVASCIIIVSKQPPQEDILVSFADDSLTDFGSIDKFIQENHTTIKAKNLDDSIWQLEQPKMLNIKTKIETSSQKLSVVPDLSIYRGITTGYNQAFVVHEEIVNQLLKLDPKNNQIIKPLLQGRNIRKWTYNESDTYLLQTEYNLNVPKLYPTIFSHLRRYKKELVKRTDQGKNWWNLRACKYYSEFEKEKIVWGLTADKWAFSYDEKKHYLPSNGYILISESLSLKYLLALLNSRLMEFYFSFIGVMTAGGAYTLKHETIQELPVKNLKTEEQKPLIGLVNKILVITKDKDYLENQAKQTRIKELEKQIDQMVYKLYGLTQEEIKIVENFNKK